jgi:hypothetical protein
LKKRFGIGRDQLQLEFNNLMKEMGTVRNSASALGSDFNSNKRADVDALRAHIRNRKMQLRIEDGGGDRFADDFVEEDTKIFGLTTLGIEEKKSEEGDNRENNLNNEADEEEERDGRLSISPTSFIASVVSTVVEQEPPQDQSVTLKALERQLGLHQIAIANSMKPKRTVGPKPWFTQSGKSKLLVSSSSATTLNSHFFGTQPFSRAGAGSPLASYLPTSTAAAKLLLNDGFDEESVSLESLGSASRTSLLDEKAREEFVKQDFRARTHSAESNRWEQRFGVISGEKNARGSNRNSHSRLSRTAPGADGAAFDMDFAAEQAKAYDKSHPKPLVDIEALDLSAALDVTLPREPQTSNESGFLEELVPSNSNQRGKKAVAADEQHNPKRQLSSPYTTLLSDDAFADQLSSRKNKFAGTNQQQQQQQQQQQPKSVKLEKLRANVGGSNSEMQRSQISLFSSPYSSVVLPKSNLMQRLDKRGKSKALSGW